MSSGASTRSKKEWRVINCENDSTKESHHLTTGTFNYVVKDPDCYRLGVQFWIKDQRWAKPQPLCPRT
jgi:hypothetical protein